MADGNVDVDIELVDAGNGGRSIRNSALRRLRVLAQDISENNTELTAERAGAALELARTAEVLDMIPENIMQVLRLISGEMSMQSSSEEEAAKKEEEKKREKLKQENSLKCMLCDKNDRNMITCCCVGCSKLYQEDMLQLRIVCSSCKFRIEKNYSQITAMFKHKKTPKDEQNALLVKNFSCPTCRGALLPQFILLNEKKLAQAHVVLGWTNCIGCGTGITPETMGEHIFSCEKIHSAQDEGVANYIKDAISLSFSHCKALEKERLRVKSENINNFEKLSEVVAKEHNDSLKVDFRTGFKRSVTDSERFKRASDALSNPATSTLKRVRRREPIASSSSISSCVTSKK